MSEFKMPSLGADMKDGILAEWRIKPGEKVKRGDIIADVDTQKGLIEIEVYDDGTVEKLLIPEGEKVPVGTPLAIINYESAEVRGQKPDKPPPEIPEEKPGEGPEKAPEEVPGKKPGEGPPEKPAELPEEEPQEIPEKPREEEHGNLMTENKVRLRISPLARKIAMENKIEPDALADRFGEKIIHKADVMQLLKQIETKSNGDITDPETAKAKVSGTSAVREAMAAAMTKSNREIPHYYLQSTADLTDTISLLQDFNEGKEMKNRILLPAVYIKAVAEALSGNQVFNAVYENEELILKKDIHIGFAISLKKGGLLIPAIKHAAEKSVTEIMEILNDLIPRTRNGKLTSSEITSPVITLTNLGDEGAENVFGMIYPPQVALIGTGKVKDTVAAVNGMIAIRKTVNISLSADHRATEGHQGSRFLNDIVKSLENFRFETPS